MLVLSLWSLRFETGPSVEECVGHVEISLFRLVAGVPLRETFIVRKQDEAGARAITGEVDVELYYSHISTVPMKRRRVARRQSSC